MEILLGILGTIGILTVGLGVPGAFYVFGKRLWFPNLLRPSKTLKDFPGVRFEGFFSPPSVNEGIKIYKKLWIETFGESEAFHTVFDSLDIRFTDEPIVFFENGEERIAAGIVDSKFRIRVYDKNCTPVKNENGEYYKTQSGRYACESLYPEDVVLSNTELAHELNHLGLLFVFGDADNTHQTTIWKEKLFDIEKKWKLSMKSMGY